MKSPARPSANGAFRIGTPSNPWSPRARSSSSRTHARDVRMLLRSATHAGIALGRRQRRLEMAMCLVAGPKILLLDDPTAGSRAPTPTIPSDLLKEIRGTRDITMSDHRARLHVVFTSPKRITVLAQGTPLVETRPRRSRATPRSRKPISATPCVRTMVDDVQARFEIARQPRSHGAGVSFVYDLHAY